LLVFEGTYVRLLLHRPRDATVVHRHTVFCHRGARMNLMASTDPVTPNQHPQHNTQEN